MMSMNPWKEGDGMTELSVTLKYGTGDASWLVLRGATAGEMKEALEEATGISGEGITLVDQIHNATQHIHSVGRMGTILGATVIPESESAGAPATQPQAAAQAPAAAAPAPGPTLLEKIAQAGSASDLSDLFLKNQAAFTGDKTLMDALEARSKAI